jgi:hypothetical protein
MQSTDDRSDLPVMRLQRQMATAMREPDPDAFVALCHPDIEFQTYGLGARQLHGTDEILEWWRTMRDATAYRVTLGEVTPISDRVAFIEGRIQFERDGWFTDRHGHWVMIERDGLAWRYRPVADRAAAAEYARSLGVLDG